MQSDRTTGRALAGVLALLTIFGPISMDLYLPVLPALTTELGAATSVAQLTITACLLGLAFGQVVAGPLSDRFGRRTPLLVGLVAYVVTSIACAVSPTVEVLVVARFIQGLAGAVGIVIAQAAGRDIYSGGQLARYYGRLTVLGGLAAIVGPVIGGQLATVTDWRGIFAFLAAIGVAILVLALAIFRETLPQQQRTGGGLAPTITGFGTLLRDRVFLGAVLVTGFTNAALFAYLSGATFVLQGIYGLSPQEYAYAFGLNSLGFMVFGFAAGRATERWSETGTLAVGLVMCMAGAAGLLATATLQLPLVAIVLSLLTMVSGVAVTTPPATTLALTGYPHMAGTASSLLGLARFAFGGVAAPLIGLGGANDALPLGIVAVVSMSLAVGAYMTYIRAPRRTPVTRPRGARRLALAMLSAAVVASLLATAERAHAAPADAAQAASSIRITVRVGDTTLRARLRANPTTRSLLGRLPLTAVFRDFHGQEKLTRIRPGLSTRRATAGASARRGDIAYYAPDRVLVLYYASLPYTPGVITLGRFTDDVEPIASRTAPFRARIKR